MWPASAHLIRSSTARRGLISISTSGVDSIAIDSGLAECGTDTDRKFGRPGGGGAWPPVDIYWARGSSGASCCVASDRFARNNGVVRGPWIDWGAWIARYAWGSARLQAAHASTGVLWTPGFERMTLEEWMRTEWFASWRERWADSCVVARSLGGARGRLRDLADGRRGAHCARC